VQWGGRVFICVGVLSLRLEQVLWGASCPCVFQFARLAYESPKKSHVNSTHTDIQQAASEVCGANISHV